MTSPDGPGQAGEHPDHGDSPDRHPADGHSDRSHSDDGHDGRLTSGHLTGGRPAEADLAGAATDDVNAEIWKSGQTAADYIAQAQAQQPRRAVHLRLLADLLPFAPSDAFTFADLGAGTGACAQAVLERFPRAEAVLADFSAAMMSEGERQLAPFAGRYRYVELDLGSGNWPDTMPSGLDAVVTSMCVHHLPDERKQGLFTAIFDRLAPGGWYLNYDCVRSADEVVAAAWERAADRADPAAAARRQHRSADDDHRWANHVRHIAPLDDQLCYLREAGFGGIDVFWKQLDHVIFGGHRPG